MSLSRIQSLGLAAVLEDCSVQLDILGLRLAVQTDREQGPAAAQEKARLTKLRRDCQYVSQQVFKLHSELEEKQSISSLLQVVEEEEQKKKAEDMRREAVAEQKQRRQTLDRQKDKLRQKTETLEDIHRQTRLVNFQVMEQSDRMARKKKLEEASIALQLKEVQRTNSHTEEQLEEQRKKVQLQLMEERKVHEKSKTFLKNRHTELQQQLQQWRQRTTQMQQEKEQQLNSVCCKRTVNLDRLTEMRRKFKEMELVVMDDKEEQKKLRQQQAEARAATKLQAWWRGCKVRRGLGSFKKADDKKGKKKNKKKKGGKNNKK
ncbi:dynein regulatory complex protein 9-like [Anarrhichthys ocellatus]|uniref:dynein regulatory complex protein 9-like n=1 Tax=Anarrhichthys ocellatus TaxID=433405 RepID=UPI0012EE037A|nr:dynein regulatory complex protein 9-like [Anarrhichthys ocellatus]